MAKIDKAVKELVKNVKILRTPKPIVPRPANEIITHQKIKYPE